MEAKIHKLLSELISENEKRQAQICREQDLGNQRMRLIYEFNDTLKFIKMLESLTK